MSRSRKEQKRYRYKHHNEVCEKWGRWYGAQSTCVCDSWHDYHWYCWPAPSWWHRDVRRSERAFTRNKMQRARAGRRDWSTVDERRGDEYYW